MAKQITGRGEALDNYVINYGTRETPLMRRLRADTQEMTAGNMQIGPDQGALLSFLVRLIGARHGLEIGTFTGYSALAIASSLPADGKLVCCDVSEEWTAVARKYWREAGLADRIELRIAPALETLAELETKAAKFDFAFIDADKPSYDAYYEYCLRLVRPGGLIAIDNVLWSGAVTNLSDRSEATLALRALNSKISNDTRADLCLLPIGDGLTLVRPR
jgi:caffeoyl-CoA O-methyltransferase